MFLPNSYHVFAAFPVHFAPVEKERDSKNVTVGAILKPFPIISVEILMVPLSNDSEEKKRLTCSITALTES